MRLELIKEKIPAAQLDVDAAYAEFQKKTGNTNPEVFLEHLKNQGAISGTLFCEIHAAEEISVSQFSGSIVSEAIGDTSEPKAKEPTGTAETLASEVTSSSQQKNAPLSSKRYAFLGQLGKGAMGEVHIARDVDLQRKVAFKRMISKVAKNPKLISRFFSEVQVTSQLDHPNILPVYGLEVAPDGTLGYSMKLVQGKALSDILNEAKEAHKKGTVEDEGDELAARLEHFLKVCDAISYAHAKGVLHRDLKPDNIMVGRYNQVYVMDWGICRVIGSKDPEADQLVGREAGEDSVSRTQVGTILGTPIYMSPEQAVGKNDILDERSDLYTLGIILYELVSLKPALSGATVTDVLIKASKAHKEPLVHINPKEKIPVEIQAIIEKATKLAPADRYQNVSKFSEDIRRYLRGDEILAKPDTSLQKVLRFIRHHQMGTLLALIFVVLVGAGVGISFGLLHKENVHARRLDRLLSDVSSQAHKIDTYLGHCELLVENLAGRAAEVLTNAKAIEARPYFNSDYSNAALRPNDAIESSYFGAPVSFESLVFKTALGVSSESVLGRAQNLLRLKNPMKYAMLESIPGIGSPEKLSPEGIKKQLELVAQKGAPMHRVFIAVEDGLLAAYPGYGGYPEDYDPRKRPYYEGAAHKWDVHWSTPYEDAINKELLLITCATSIYDDEEHFLGVTGAEFTFDYVGKELIDLPEAPYELESFLVNGEGRIVIHSLHSGKTSEVSSKISQPLPFEEVRQAIIAKKGEGLVEWNENTISYSPIYELGWYYVVVADNNLLFQ